MIRRRLPRYAELYVVSDLHLGGTKGVRMFNQGKELGEFIAWLSTREASGEGGIALLLNGDIFDSLAENIRRYVADPDEAEELVEAVLDHDDFKPITDALRAFVAAANHELIISGGNHDLELAYHNVREVILEKIGATHQPERGRVTFDVMGAGYPCRVGDDAFEAEVLCLRGNEYDPWNAISPESIARLVRAGTHRKVSPLAEDPPNAGTHMVIEVMNAIKKTYPFVDLLKPEIETVFSVLIALDPDVVRKMGAGLGSLARKSSVGAWRVARVLGEEAPEPAPDATDWSWAPGANFQAHLDKTSKGSLMADAMEDARHDVVPEDLADDGTLGVWTGLENLARFVGYRLFKEDRKEALRSALLDWVGSDDTWDLDGPDDVFDAVSKHVSSAIDVVIAGHTHLRRQMKRGRGLYINTGTWARLIRLEKWMLEGSNFDKIWDALPSPTLATLDAVIFNRDGVPTELIRREPTVAVVRATPTRVEAALCEFHGGEPSPVVGADWVTVGGAVS